MRPEEYVWAAVTAAAIGYALLERPLRRRPRPDAATIGWCLDCREGTHTDCLGPTLCDCTHAAGGFVGNLTTAVTSIGIAQRQAREAEATAFTALSEAVRPTDADVDALAALTTTAYGRALIKAADPKPRP